MEKISDEFDFHYTRTYSSQPQPGTPISKPETPRGVKHWGLRTLWCYYIDRHLDLIEQAQKVWHASTKSKMERMTPQSAKDFAAQTMTNGDAKVENFKFPQPNPRNALPGTAGSSFNTESRYGMWGGNALGKLGL